MFFLRLMIMAAALAGLSFATPINAALYDNGGRASQLSTDGGAAGVANDGVLDAGFTDTNFQSHPWWNVTFDKPYFISSISVHGRGGWPYDGGLLISVILKDLAGAEVWSKTGVEMKTLTTFSPDPSKGASSLTVRFDELWGNAKGELHLAEVVAMGDTTAPLPDPDPDPDPDPPAGGATPEPATYVLMAGGLAFIVILHRRRR